MSELINKNVAIKVRGVREKICGRLLHMDTSPQSLGEVGNTILEVDTGTIVIVKGNQIVSVGVVEKTTPCDLWTRSNPHDSIICKIDGEPCNADADAEKCPKVVIYNFVVSK